MRFDSGPVGVVINAANRNSYGSFWTRRPAKGPKRDNTIESGPPPAGSAVNDALALLGIPAGTLPTYPPPPHCNTRGLTGLGRHMVERMMDLGMIVNPDHMSQRGVDDTLTLAESRGYSGVISPHGWMDPRNWPRIFQLGGMAFPAAGSAQGFVDAWRTYRPKATPQFFGWGYGADLGGLATQGAGAGRIPNQVTYPFKSLDGSTTIDRQRTGERVFDYPTEGVAHYGLYAEWYEELRRAAVRGSQRTCCAAPRPTSRCGSAPSAYPPASARRLHQLRQARPGRAPAPHRFPQAPGDGGPAAAADTGLELVRRGQARGRWRSDRGDERHGRGRACREHREGPEGEGHRARHAPHTSEGQGEEDRRRTVDQASRQGQGRLRRARPQGPRGSRHHPQDGPEAKVAEALPAAGPARGPPRPANVSRRRAGSTTEAVPVRAQKEGGAQFPFVCGL